MADLNQSPYFDDHENEFNNKHYKEVLFNPGRAVQARELTQSQSFVYVQLKENFHTIYKNGAIVSGMNLSISGTTAYMTSGKFYYDGRIYEIDAQNITITGTGTENLGLKLNETFVTSSDDAALLDPASGYTNYGNPGADRLKQIWTLVKDDSNMIALWTLIDGDLQVVVTDKWSDLMNILAKRTYDESGNYLVNGMELDIEDNIDTTKVDYIINPGSAYVKGYNITLPSPKRIIVDKAMNYDTRGNEPKTWTTGTYKYSLIEYYVKSLGEVNGQVQTTIYVTKGVTNGQDTITANSDSNNPPAIQGKTFTSIISLDEITSKDGNTTYTNGSDYVLTNNNIDWSPGGSEPAEGETYKVKFTYSKTFTEETEYSLVQDTTDDRQYYIEFASNLDNASYPDYTEYPINGTVVYVDYDFYLSRADLISVDYKGNFIVKTGIDTKWDITIVPDDSNDYLHLGYIKLMPNRGANDANIVNYGFKRSTMYTLFNALKRLSDVEYNQAQNALESQVENSELPTELKGLLVDNFEDFGKSDVGSSDFYCSMDDVNNEMGMAVLHEVNNFDFDNSTLTNIDNFGNSLTPSLALKKLSDYIILEQTQKTHTENLNPYGFLDANTGFETIKPELDYWVNESIQKAYRNQNNIQYRDIYTYHYIIRGGRFPDYYIHNTTTRTIQSNITNRLLSKSLLSKNYITYARNIDISINGEKWYPNCKILILFDDKPLDVQPDGETWDSSSQGTLWDNYNYNGIDYKCPISQANGSVKCKITVPQGTKTGSHKITLKNTATDYSFSTRFVSEGIKKIYEELILRQGSEIIERIHDTTRVHDPLAQSFVFDKDTVLTGIDLYFESKDTTANAFLEMGWMENGYPSTASNFHYQEIAPSEVNISTDGSAVTHIDFTKPIIIPTKKEFFIGIGSSSNQYNLFVSKMGEMENSTGKLVVKNPYLNGVFFKSSNNSSWNAFQDIDLSFKLYSAKYETSGSIVTPTITPTDSFCFFKYFSDAQLMADSDIKYYYSIDGGSSWIPYSLKHAFIDTNGEHTNIKLKFELTGNGYTTPILFKSADQIITSKYDTSKDNYYVTKTVTDVPEYNDVKMAFDIRLSSGTGYNLYFSPDDTLYIQIPEGNKISEIVEDASSTEPKYKREYEFSLTDLYKVDISSVSGTPTVNSTISSSTGGGNPVGTLLAVDGTNAIFEITSGILTNGETITLSDSSNFVINNQHNMIDNTVFKGKIKLTGTACSSPLFSEMKFIMKKI